MFNKKPCDMKEEEFEKLEQYRNWKIGNGEPIEEDILYTRAGGNENCLHCDLPT